MVICSNIISYLINELTNFHVDIYMESFPAMELVYAGNLLSYKKEHYRLVAWALEQTDGCNCGIARSPLLAF